MRSWRSKGKHRDPVPARRGAGTEHHGLGGSTRSLRSHSSGSWKAKIKGEGESTRTFGSEDLRIILLRCGHRRGGKDEPGAEKQNMRVDRERDRGSPASHRDKARQWGPERSRGYLNVGSAHSRCSVCNHSKVGQCPQPGGSDSPSTCPATPAAWEGPGPSRGPAPSPVQAAHLEPPPEEGTGDLGGSPEASDAAGDMSSPDGPSFPSSGLLSGGTSPSGDEGFFPFVLERRDSFLGGGPGPEEPEDLALQLQQKEKDLLLAAELGKMLLERNEELRRQLETLSTQHSEREERLQQENHELRRGLAARGAEWEARAVELEGDVEALRAQLGEQRSEQQDSGRERARALGELSEQNLRLSQQLAQASQTEQELQRELDTLRGQCQAQALAGAELRTRLESLQGENQMLQSRRQDLEAQIRGLREEVEKGQGRLQTTHEELLLLKRERREHSLELERARSEAGEALSALRRLQRRVSELEEESRLQDADVSSASLQSELAHSLEEYGQGAVARGDAPIALQQAELQALREEQQRQKELRAHDDPGEALNRALSDRDEAVNKALELSLELKRVSLERDSLSRELLRAISQKVALTQELEAWQDDMQVVIGQQLRSQRQKELSAAASSSTPRRAAPRFSLRLGPGPAGGFLSNLFRRT
nr:BICD family-like cargo adapter 2 isoform X2 [Saimiri boliviensis boliviensis]